MTVATKEPVTVGGWYELTDGRVQRFAWHSGRLKAHEIVASWAALAAREQGGPRATIRTRTVGEHFASEATVLDEDGMPLHTTRVFPYGFEAQAYRAAEEWAVEHGYTVAEEAGAA